MSEVPPRLGVAELKRAGDEDLAKLGIEVVAPDEVAASRYCHPAMLALRRRPSPHSVCIDLACDLSGGFSHAGPCEPCGCGLRHAVEECPDGWPDAGAELDRLGEALRVLGDDASEADPGAVGEDGGEPEVVVGLGAAGVGDGGLVGHAPRNGADEPGQQGRREEK